jgi:hypothetical protein
MIVCLLMVMVREDCLSLSSTNKQSSLTITINKQSFLTITINKQTIISHHYHQQTNNLLSPLSSTNKQLSLTVMVRDDCLFVNGNGER